MSDTSSKITTDLDVDDPIEIDANYRFDKSDRRYLDNQARGSQIHLKDSLLSGYAATWGIVSGSSDSIEAGDCVCFVRDEVFKAVAANLTDAGCVAGVATIAAAPGGKINFAHSGTIPSSISGLSDGTAYPVRVNQTTAKLERVASIGETDFAVGVSNTSGGVTLATGTIAGGIVISGATKTAIALVDLDEGDVICDGLDPSDPTKVTLATTAARASAGSVKGVAVTSVSAGELVQYADAGDIVDLGLGQPNIDELPTWVIVNSTGQAELKDVPLPGDYVLGRADGEQGYVTINPRSPFFEKVHPQNPRFGALGDGSTDDSTALRTAIESAIIDPPINGQNFTSHDTVLPPGTYVLDKPIHIKQYNQKIQGSLGATNIRITNFAGPAFYVAPDYDEFPHEEIEDWGNAATMSTDFLHPHTLKFTDAGEGFYVHGKSSLCIDVGVQRYAGSWTSGSWGNIISSSGGFYPSQTSAFGIWLNEDGRVEAWVYTLASGFATVDAIAGTISDTDVHHIRLRFESGTVKLFVDEVEHDSASVTGNIVQDHGERVWFGAGYLSELGGPSTIIAPNVHVPYLHVRNAPPVGNTAPSTIEDVVETGTTMFLCTFDELDGVFVKARTLRTVAGSIIDAWYPHHYSNVGFDSLSAVEISDIQFTNLYGAAVVADACNAIDIHDLAGITKHGILLYQNCYVSKVRRITFTGAESKRGTGIHLNNCVAANSMGDIQLAGYNYAISSRETSFSIHGRNYIVNNQHPLSVVRAQYLYQAGEFAVSDEGVSTFIPGFVQYPVEFTQCGNIHLASLLGGFTDTGTAANCFARFNSFNTAENRLRAVIEAPFLTLIESDGHFELQGLEAGDYIRIILPNRSDVSIPYLSTASQVDAADFFSVDEGGAFAASGWDTAEHSGGGLEVRAISGTDDIATMIGRTPQLDDADADEAITFIRDGAGTFLIDRSSVGGFILALEDQEVNAPTTEITIQGQAVASSGSEVTGGAVVLKGGQGQSRDGYDDGPARVMTAHGAGYETTAYADGATADAGKSTLKKTRVVKWENENGKTHVLSELFDTTTETDAETNIADFTLESTGKNIKVVAQIIGSLGTTSMDSGVVSQTYRWNGTDYVENGDTAGGRQSDLDPDSTAIDPNLSIQDSTTGHFRVNVTPPSASTMKWSVLLQIHAADRT